VFEVEISVRTPDPTTHLVEVDITAPSRGPQATLWFAAWTPGSYLIREYARNVRRIAATVDGAPARCVKRSKDAWEVDAPAGAQVRWRVWVHALEVGVRAAHCDGTHLFVHPAAVLPIAADAHELPLPGPYRLRVHAPAGASLTTLLPASLALTADAVDARRAVDGAIELHADSLDALLDGPIELGDHTIHTLPAPAQHVSLSVWGEPWPAAALAQPLAAGVAAAEALFDGPAVAPYRFIVHHVVGARGGLEHAHGSVLGVDADDTAPLRGLTDPPEEDGPARTALLDVATLAIHELVHAWNGKRLRPAALGPFDYRRENPTRELWVVEGWTSYYEGLLLARAGVMRPAELFARWSKTLTRIEATPGRLEQSLEDASWDAWIKAYRPQPDTRNSTVDYYGKGAFVALCLDAWLRGLEPAAGGPPRSLDSVVRLAWQRYSGAHGYTGDDVLALIAEVAGGPVPEPVRSWWQAPGDPPDAALGPLGLRIVRRPSDDPWLGITTEIRDAAVRVSFVAANSPAERAGVEPGDEWLALAAEGGPWVRVRGGSEARACAHLRRGGARLLVGRRERVHELSLELGEGPSFPTIERDPGAPPQARARYRAWIGAFATEEPWPALSSPSAGESAEDGTP
jgi:predicted metalloprotease with PDZ domain